MENNREALLDGALDDISALLGEIAKDGKLFYDAESKYLNAQQLRHIVYCIHDIKKVGEGENETGSYGVVLMPLVEEAE